MPEGDTIFLLRRRLTPPLVGRTLVEADLRVPRHATADLRGRQVLEHDTHGKHLLTRLSGGLTLHTHLRMDGSWSVTGPDKSLPARLMPDVRVVLGTDEGHTAYGVLLPVVDLVPTDLESQVVGHLGPDPLRSDFDLDEAVRRFEARAGEPVISVLLDQRVVAGFGNLWANELCFLRGHNPWTPAGEVDARALLSLGARALRQSAHTPRAYQVTTGDTRRGRQHYVAGRRRRPCLRCSTPIAWQDAVPGQPGERVTWWCPHCQPGPAGRPPRARPTE